MTQYLITRPNYLAHRKNFFNDVVPTWPFAVLNSPFNFPTKHVWNSLFNQTQKTLATDIEENEKEYVVSIDVPGAAKDQLQLSFDDGNLSVSYEINEKTTEGENEETAATEAESENEVTAEEATDKAGDPDDNAQETTDEKAIAKQEQNETQLDVPHYIKRERRYASAKRTFFVGKNIDADNIAAEYNDGVLKVVLPKITEDDSAVTIDIA